MLWLHNRPWCHSSNPRNIAKHPRKRSEEIPVFFYKYMLTIVYNDDNIRVSNTTTLKGDGKMLVKAGRNEFELVRSDVVIDNGACIQIVTRKAGHGWNTSTPIIAKKRWSGYLKSGAFELFETKLKGTTHEVKYYRLKK